MPYLTRRLTLSLAVVASAALPGICAAQASPIVDTLRFGDQSSESAHRLDAQLSETVAGALQQPARRFLPRGGDEWRGGEASFQLRVKPAGQNYLSVKLWGEDVSGGQATLYCDGKQ